MIDSVDPDQTASVSIESTIFVHTYMCKYSRTSLSRTRLFRITAYLEVKIWSLF